MATATPREEKKYYVGLNVDAEFKKLLVDVSQYLGISLSSLIREALLQYLRDLSPSLPADYRVRILQALAASRIQRVVRGYKYKIQE